MATLEAGSSIGTKRDRDEDDELVGLQEAASGAGDDRDDYTDEEEEEEEEATDERPAKVYRTSGGKPPIKHQQRSRSRTSSRRS